jgi:hypothetical protein
MKKIYVLFEYSNSCFDLANVNKRLVAVYDDLELATDTQKTLVEMRKLDQERESFQAALVFRYTIEEFELNSNRDHN